MATEPNSIKNDLLKNLCEEVMNIFHNKIQDGCITGYILNDYE